MDESNNSNDGTVKIYKLKGASNYRIWSAEVSALLEGKGLLGITLGDETRPDGLHTPQSSTQTVGGSRNRRGGQASIARHTSPVETEDRGLEESPIDKWRRRDARSRSLIMTYCQVHMKDKIVHLTTAKEMWDTLKKDCRPASNVSLATYTNRFYSYEPKKDATIDSISNELQELQSMIFMTKEDEKPTELSKISALLRAARKLHLDFDTRIEILEDKLSSLDYETTVVALKETESRIKASKPKATNDEEKSLATEEHKRGQSKKWRGNSQRGRGGRSRGQKRIWMGCYTCGGDHMQRNCREWLNSPEGGACKHHKGPHENWGRPSGSTGPLPSPGIKRSDTRSQTQEMINEEEAHLTVDLCDEIPRDKCWGALTEQSNGRELTWVIDSACTRHMTYSREAFDEYIELEKPRKVRVANGAYIYGIGLGSITIRVFISELEVRELTLSDVLHVPQIAGNLISVPQLQSCRILTETTESLKENAIILTKDGRKIASGTRVGSQYILDSVGLETAAVASDEGRWMENIHQKFGHIHVRGLRGLHHVVRDLSTPIPVDQLSSVCEICILAKQPKIINRQSSEKAGEPLERVFGDYWGPYSIPTLFGERGFYSLTDQKTRKVWVFLVKDRKDFREKLLIWKRTTELESGQKLKTLRLDNAGEFRSIEKELQDEFGIQIEWTTTYTPEQNGVSERANRTLVSLARAMLIDSRLPYKFWGEAVKTACYLRNRTPSGPGGLTPEEAFTGKRPGIRHIIPWGCLAFHQVPSEKRLKLEPVSVRTAFVGYTESTQQFRLYDPKRGIITSTRPRFIENKRLKYSWSTKTPAEAAEEPESSEAELDFDRSRDEEPELEKRKNDRADNSGNANSGDDAQEELIEEELEPEVLGRGLRIRKAKRFFDELGDGALAALADELIVPPKDYDSAVDHPKYSRQWKDAVTDELEKLFSLGTFEYVDLPPGKETVDTKWVFTIKYTPTGLVDRFKARLVARGFSQREGDDFWETFSPTIRYESIRLILAIACAENLEIHQADVDTAYPRARLHAEVFVSNIKGLILPPGKVLRIHKALYGLKQSGREWYIEACNTLDKFGLQPTFNDPSVFVNKDKSLVVGLYVDDMIIVARSLEEADKFKRNFGAVHKLEDLGDIHKYLGLTITRDRTKRMLYISQESFTRKLIEDYLSPGDYTASTPVTSRESLTKAKSNEPRADIAQFQKAIGSLMYLQRGSRPDIAFIVCRLAQYCSDPAIRHWNALTRVIRYLKGTQDYGIRYGSYGRLTSDLRGFSDSDYAGDPEDRLSTYGHIFTLCKGPISWTSKKQRSVSTSTTEAEYVALCQAGKQAIWTRGLLKELGRMNLLENDFSVPISCDNQAAIGLAENPENHARSKHIDVQFHYIRQLVAYNYIRVEFCPSTHMLADVLTKPLSKRLFGTCIREMVHTGR